MRLSLKNKTAVVTGGGGVLGSAISEALLAHGAQVIILGRTEGKLRQRVEDWARKGWEKADFYAADVMDKKSIAKVHQSILDAGYSVDILINAAGGNRPAATAAAEEMLDGTPLEDSFFGMDIAAFRDVFDLNFIGTLIPSLEFASDMLRDGGSIINISSMAAQQPLTKVGGYSASKAAIDNFTRWLAVHLAKKKVRVNAIAPGFFLSDQNRFLLYEEDGKTLTARGRKIIQNTPMGSFGDPEDLKAATLYLAGDGSRFVTGTVLPVDGGFSAFSGV